VPWTSVDLQQKSFPVSPSDGGSITATEESAAEAALIRLEEYTSSLQASEPAAPSIAQQVGFGPLLERREKEASWEDDGSQSETIAQPVEPLCPYRNDNIYHLSTGHSTHHLSTAEEQQRLQAALGVDHMPATSFKSDPPGPAWPETRQSFHGEQVLVEKYPTDSYKSYPTNVAMAHNHRHCSDLPALSYPPPYGSNGQTQCSHGCSGVADTTSGYHRTPMVGNSWQASLNNTQAPAIYVSFMFAPQACCSHVPSQYGAPQSFCGY
jgi:hypothetical protein